MAKKRTRRTKEQIELDNAKAQAQKDMQSEGLGDTIAKITKATGIDKLVKFIAGEDCGCDERRKKLNELLPYETTKCLEEEEYNYLHEFFERNPNTVQPSEQKRMVDIATRVFNKRYEVSGCGGCVRDMVNRLRTVYSAY